MENTYSELKGNLIKIIDEINTFFNSHSKVSIEHLKEKLTENIFNIVVMGKFKRGKTSLINALIDKHCIANGVRSLLLAFGISHLTFLVIIYRPSPIAYLFTIHQSPFTVFIRLRLRLRETQHQHHITYISSHISHLA